MARYDFARIFKGDDGSEFLYARGLLTVTVPGLVKTKTGKLATPTLRVDEEGNLQNYFYKDGKPLPLFDYSGDGKEKELVQPAMTGNTKEKKILLWVNENGKDSFFALEAWETQAKRLNMFYKKGQPCCILAHKVITKGAVTGQKEVVWCIEDICKVKPDIEYTKKVETKESNTDSSNTGFTPVVETSDLPFGD